MMTVVRKSMFETNSSSVHTLVLRKEPSNRYIGEKEDGFPSSLLQLSSDVPVQSS